MQFGKNETRANQIESEINNVNELNNYFSESDNVKVNKFFEMYPFATKAIIDPMIQLSKMSKYFLK